MNNGDRDGEQTEGTRLAATMGMATIKDALREMLQDATPSPFFCRENDLVGGWSVTAVDAPLSSGVHELGGFVHRADAELTAAVHNVLPELLDALDVQVHEIERLREALRMILADEVYTTDVAHLRVKEIAKAALINRVAFDA